MLKGSTPLDPRFSSLDTSPAIQAGAMEQQAIVNISSSINQAVQNIEQKRMDKEAQEMRMSALSPLLEQSGLAGSRGTETFNAALKQLSKSDDLLGQMQNLSTIQLAKQELEQEAIKKTAEGTPLLVTEKELEGLGAANVTPRVVDGETLYEVKSQNLSKVDDKQFIEGLEKIGDSITVDTDNDGKKDTRYTRMGTGSIEAESLVKEEELTPFQKKFEESLGERLAEYTESGRAIAKANIETYDDLINKLKSGELKTRGFTDYLPEAFGFRETMRALLQPIKEDAVNNVMGVVFQSLRATLGAQFTQREAERLVAAAYNPKLTEQQNLTRLERAKKILEETVKAKDQLLAWGSSGQRLSDYKGPLPIDVYRSSVANLKNELDAPTVGDDDKKPLVIKERK
jgi:DNA-binding transcriptional regulator YhcF (GntR family)